MKPINPYWHRIRWKSGDRNGEFYFAHMPWGDSYTLSRTDDMKFNIHINFRKGCSENPALSSRPVSLAWAKRLVKRHVNSIAGDRVKHNFVPPPQMTESCI